MTDDDLIGVCLRHGLAMMEAAASALVANGDCAPMFAVVAGDGSALAAGIFAPFEDDEAKIRVHHALGTFAGSQRAAAVVLMWDTFVSSHATDGRLDLDAVPRPSEDPAATEQLMVEVLTSHGVMTTCPSLRYHRGDDGQVVFDEDGVQSTGCTAFGEACATIVRSLGKLHPKVSRSTALAQLLSHGFQLLADEKDAEEVEAAWRERN